MGVPPPGIGMPPLPEAAYIAKWEYRDPQGQLQGPFTREDLLEWYEQGFFPDNLPIRPSEAPAGAPFVPLAPAVPLWVAALFAAGATHPHLPRWTHVFPLPPLGPPMQAAIPDGR